MKVSIGVLYCPSLSLPSPFQGLLIESVILVTQREPLFHISRDIVAYGVDHS
jgi:hypothetical protein